MDGPPLRSAFSLDPLSPSHQFSSFFPPSLFQNKIRSNEEAEGNKDSLILLREMSAARQVFPGRITTEALGCEAQPSPGLPRLHSPSLWMLTQALLLLLGRSPSHFSNLSLLFEGAAFINMCLYLGHNDTHISHYFCSHELHRFHVFKQQTHNKFSPGYNTCFPKISSGLLLKVTFL